MNKKGLTFILIAFLIAFYTVIIFFLMLTIFNIDETDNFGTAIIFEIIGIVLIAFFILGGILSESISTGYLVPLIMVTVIYALVLDVINIVMAGTMSNNFFVLINLIVMFVYCMISIPMYVMGRK